MQMKSSIYINLTNINGARLALIFKQLCFLLPTQVYSVFVCGKLLIFWTITSIFDPKKLFENGRCDQWKIRTAWDFQYTSVLHQTAVLDHRCMPADFLAGKNTIETQSEKRSKKGHIYKIMFWFFFSRKRTMLKRVLWFILSSSCVEIEKQTKLKLYLLFSQQVFEKSKQKKVALSKDPL